MKLTIQEQLVDGLLAMGWREDVSKRGKYRVFIYPGKDTKLFVGKAGALRAGRTASDSRSLGDPSNRNATYNQVLMSAR